MCLLGLLGLWLLINFIKDPAEFINVFFIGVSRGAIFGLIALGYTLVYGILELINFAHGDVFALSGLFASTVLVTLGIEDGDSGVVILLGILATLAICMVVFALFNAGIERVAYRPLRTAPRLAALITAVGMSFIVQNVSLYFYGVNPRSETDLLPQGDAFDIGGVMLAWDKIIIVMITIPVLIGLSWMVRSTRHGKAMRATAQDRDAAAMMGINVNRTISFTFLLAGALAAAGGLTFVLEYNIRYDTGFELGLIAFTAAVLGGIGNLTGAVLGALLIGLIQSFNEGLAWHAPGSDWTRTIVFGILIAILVFRPEGLLGEQTPEGA